jgi:hypothetical protein
LSSGRWRVRPILSRAWRGDAENWTTVKREMLFPRSRTAKGLLYLASRFWFHSTGGWTGLRSVRKRSDGSEILRIVSPLDRPVDFHRWPPSYTRKSNAQSSLSCCAAKIHLPRSILFNTFAWKICASLLLSSASQAGVYVFGSFYY